MVINMLCCRIEGIPDEIKALYKTSWELSQKCIIDMAADRGNFIAWPIGLYFITWPGYSYYSSYH